MTDTNTATTEKTVDATTPADTTVATLAGGAASADKTADTTVADTTKTAADTTADTTKTTDWRDQFAGDDKDFRKRLERFTTPADVAKSYRSLEQKLSSGEYKKVLDPKASAEEVATWRKENGIPDKPDAYLEKLALPNGMVLGDEDKPVVSAFAEMAQSKNWDTKQFNDSVAWYYETQTKLAQQRQAADNDFMSTAEDALRDQWGSDYKRNINIVGSIRDMMPEGLRDRLMAGRTADGNRIGNDPEMLSWLVQMGRELNPAATVLPAGTSDPAKGVDDRLAEISKMRQTDPDGYDRDKKLQAEELELLDAKAKLRKRAA